MRGKHRNPVCGDIKTIFLKRYLIDFEIKKTKSIRGKLRKPMFGNFEIRIQTGICSVLKTCFEN